MTNTAHSPRTAGGGISARPLQGAKSEVSVSPDPLVSYDFNVANHLLFFKVGTLMRKSVVRFVRLQCIEPSPSLQSTHAFL